MIPRKIPTPQYNSILVILERYNNLLIEASSQGSDPTIESKFYWFSGNIEMISGQRKMASYIILS